MYGLQYHRMKKWLSKKELAKLAGCSAQTITRLEKDMPLSTWCGIIDDCAKALGVSMDEIVREYPNRILSAGDHPSTESRTENPHNCLSQYRKTKNLTFEELAIRLGNSTREAGRIACVRSVPLDKDIQKLATFEGISVEDFRRLYDLKGETAA